VLGRIAITSSKEIKSRTKSDLRKRKIELYIELGAQYLAYIDAIKLVGKFSKPEHKKRITLAKRKYSNRILHTVGKRQYQRNKGRLRRLICVEFNWCKRNKKLSKFRKTASYVAILSILIAPSIPEWAYGSTLILLAIKINKDLDKFCKCRSR